MSSNANGVENWAGALPQARVEGNWLPAGDRTAAQPLPPEELLEQLKMPGGLASAGLVLLAVGILFLLPNIGYIAGGRAAEGVVIEIESRPSSRGTMYAPVVAYAVNGNQYAVASSQSTSWNTYRVGDAVPVLYFPADPEEATIGGFQQLYLLPSFFGLPAFALITAGLVLGSYVVRKAGWRILPA